MVGPRTQLGSKAGTLSHRSFSQPRGFLLISIGFLFLGGAVEVHQSASPLKAWSASEIWTLSSRRPARAQRICIFISSFFSFHHLCFFPLLILDPRIGGTILLTTPAFFFNLPLFSEGDGSPSADVRHGGILNSLSFVCTSPQSHHRRTL